MADSLMEDVEEEIESEAGGGGEFIPDANIPLTKQYAALELQRRDLEAELKTVKEKAAAVEKLLLDEFAETGISNCRVSVETENGTESLTLYLKREYFVSKRGDVDTDTLCGLLKEAGLGYLVKDGYNASSLKAALVERRAKDEAIPESLAAALNQGEKFRVATRK